MTQPEVGQWWQNNATRAWVVGLKRNGIAVCEFECGTLGTLHPNSGWTLLPDCTGWDWEPDKVFREFDVSPGDGWRWLGDDEIVQASDEVFRADEGMFVKPMTRAGKTVTHFASDDYPVRRRLEVPTTRTIKLCLVVYWGRPEHPLSKIITEQELDRYRKAWRTLHVVSESTVEVPL
tara:strand:+ start:834 stop:1364 length:531 start_codon:yes stop_codon:yes gene_type:complete